jgi:hypothetical protein
MMDEERTQLQYQRLSLPFLLISGIFFSFFLVLAAIIIVYLFQGFEALSYLESPPEKLNTLRYFTGVWISVLWIFIMVIPFIGDLLLMYELKRQTQNWKRLLPLTIDMGVIMISISILIVEVFFTPLSTEIQSILFYLFETGFALLPLCSAYFLRSYKRIDPDTSEIQMTPMVVIGIVALIFLLYFFISLVFFYVTSAFPQNYFLNIVNQIWAVITVIYFIFLLPFIGVQFLRIGLRYRNLSGHERDKPMMPR